MTIDHNAIGQHNRNNEGVILSSLKQKVVHGFFWAFMERLGTQGVSFVVSLVLARLLTPSDYGTIALLSIFLAISGVLASSGFGSALVQKKDATELDFNSVFYISIVLSSIMYGALFCVAPWIAQFYNTPELCIFTRLLGLNLIVSAINGIQSAELSRKLLFHLSFRISLIGSLVTPCVGIPLAYLGYGAWALVWSSMAGAVVGTVTRWYFIAWRPAWMFSWASVRTLFSFGWKMVISALLDTGYNNLYGLLIGRFYSKDELAFVNKGRSVPQLAMDTINSTLGGVAFPALAQVQDRRERVRDTMRRMMTMSTFLVFPLMVGCALCAPVLFPLLFGEQWVPAVPYAQLACLSFALWPFHTINLQGIMALGRSDLFLGLEIIKKIVGLTMLLIAIPYGVFWMMALGAFVSSPLSVIINAWPNRRLLNYSIGMQIRDVLPTAMLCGVMAIVIYPLRWCPLPGWGIVLAQTSLGTTVFFVLAWWFRLAPMREFASLALPVIATHTPRFFRSVLDAFGNRLK